MNADGPAVKHLEAAAVACCPHCPLVPLVLFVLRRQGTGTWRGSVPPPCTQCRSGAPAICVEVGAAADVPVAIADEVAELAVWPALVTWLHPPPISATAAAAADKTAARFLINAFRSFSSRTGPPYSASPAVSPT